MWERMWWMQLPDNRNSESRHGISKLKTPLWQAFCASYGYTLKPGVQGSSDTASPRSSQSHRPPVLPKSHVPGTPSTGVLREPSGCGPGSCPHEGHPCSREQPKGQDNMPWGFTVWAEYTPKCKIWGQLCSVLQVLLPERELLHVTHVVVGHGVINNAEILIRPGMHGGVEGSRANQHTVPRQLQQVAQWSQWRQKGRLQIWHLRFH